MSDYDVSVDVSADVSTDFAISLSPLGGGDDADYEYESASDVEDGDGSMVIIVDGKKKVKKMKKKAKKVSKQAGSVAEAAVKLTAIAVDAMATPAVEPKNIGAIKKGAWSTGLFNCFDYCVPNCLMASFCPCISAAQIATRLGFKYQTALLAFGVLVALEYLLYGLMFATLHTTDEADGYFYNYITGRYEAYSYEVSSTRLSFWAYLAYLLSIVIFVALWQLRTKVREKFELPGSCVEDFFISFCCSCCALAQMATHVQSYKPHTCDFGGPDELPAYAE